MSDGKSTTSAAEDASLSREIVEGRKFTLEEAIARMAGPGAMKGESPVTRLQQAQFVIESWLTDHLIDAGGALKLIIGREVANGDALISLVDRPLDALASYCRKVLDSDYLLEELTRNADSEWGRTMGERPFFDKEGRPCHPDDPYTIQNVRTKVLLLAEQLPSK